jgi:endonuclease III
MATDLRRRIRASLDRLMEAFGRPRLGRRYPPLDELILTILSQNTNDRNRDRAYEALRRRYPTWEGVLEADGADLEETIRAGGLARTKSRVIQEVLRRIKRDQGRLTLDSLATMPAREARDYLTSFKGVGEKTACCVLLFSCGHPAFPVDTHIHRVARRLGWVPAKATPAQSHARLAELIPADRFLSTHLHLITLGRRLCRPRAPACPVCPLRRLCPYAARWSGGLRSPARPGWRGPIRSRGQRRSRRAVRSAAAT